VDPQDKECNHTGAKGIGEPATIPTAPALANAIRHASGVRIAGSPITPAKLIEALSAQSKGD
jgi:xanthine dehydrogenase YagR molybdenum-binding subunit